MRLVDKLVSVHSLVFKKKKEAGNVRNTLKRHLVRQLGLLLHFGRIGAIVWIGAARPSSLDPLLPSKFLFVLCRNNGVKLRSFAIVFASVFGAVWFRREDPKWRQFFLFQSSINPIRALKHRLGVCSPGLSGRVTTCAPKEDEEISSLFWPWSVFADFSVNGERSSTHTRHVFRSGFSLFLVVVLTAACSSLGHLPPWKRIQTSREGRWPLMPSSWRPAAKSTRRRTRQHL